MKKLNNKGVTLIEVIIASVFFTIIFTGLYSGLNVITSYVNESNIKLASMNIAKSGIEKFEIYKKNQTISDSGDEWGNFIKNNGVGFYAFSGETLAPNSMTEDSYESYENWEGPLDDSGNLKTSNEGINFYRVLKFVDYDTDSTTDVKSNIFSCNLDDDLCDDGVEKTILSEPYLSNVAISGNDLTLTFSTGTIFNEKGLFIVYMGTGTVTNDFSGASTITSSTGTSDNGYEISYLTFSSNPASGNSIILDGENFIFGSSGNVEIGSSIDETIFNLKNEIIKSKEDYTAYIFYPNVCSIYQNLSFYNINTDSKFTLPTDCDSTSVTVAGNVLTLSGDFIGESLNSKMTVLPDYKLKIDLGDSGTGYEKFSGLNSPRVTNFGVQIGEDGVSSIYLLGVRVLGFDGTRQVVDEVYQKYIGDL